MSPDIKARLDESMESSRFATYDRLVDELIRRAISSLRAKAAGRVSAVPLAPAPIAPFENLIREKK
jgi:hypothetical protein